MKIENVFKCKNILCEQFNYIEKNQKKQLVLKTRKKN